MSDQPDQPSPGPPVDWEHYDLWLRVREALLALPAYFETPTNIEGMLATDIFTLNAPLAATIEEQVVHTLNHMRPVWDPEKRYQAFGFVRQAQTFPDVLLRKRTTEGQEILLGIELKGWYLLAKEGAPNFRFVASASACSERDLVVVVPWVLSNVLAGSPMVFTPFIQLARYAAQRRNYYWQHLRGANSNTDVILAKGIGPYPVKSDRISDKPTSDSGRNFGRLARYGIMDDYISKAKQIEVRGIPAEDWLKFFRKQAKDKESSAD